MTTITLTGDITIPAGPQGPTGATGPQGPQGPAGSGGGSSYGRTYLTSDITLYVSTTGSDSTGDGSSSNPWRTKQKASDYIQQKLDLAGERVVTVQSANGTYTDALSVVGPYTGGRGPAAVIFRGNNASPYNNVMQSVASTNAFTASDGAGFVIDGFRISATGNGVQTGHGLVAADGVIKFGIVAFAACNGAHMDAGPRGLIQSGWNSWGYCVSGNSNIHAIAETGGCIALNGITIVYDAAGISHGTACIQVDECGQIILVGSTFAGNGFSGKRFNAISNGIIATGGQSDTWIPGSVAGVRSLGGVYY